MDLLEKAKQRLNDVFQRHGFILEPELRELLADLYKQLVSTLHIGDRIRDWEKERHFLLINLLKFCIWLTRSVAIYIHLAKSRLGMIT